MANRLSEGSCWPLARSSWGAFSTKKTSNWNYACRERDNRKIQFLSDKPASIRTVWNWNLSRLWKEKWERRRWSMPFGAMFINHLDARRYKLIREIRARHSIEFIKLSARLRFLAESTRNTMRRVYWAPARNRAPNTFDKLVCQNCDSRLIHIKNFGR